MRIVKLTLKGKGSEKKIQVFLFPRKTGINEKKRRKILSWIK